MAYVSRLLGYLVLIAAGAACLAPSDALAQDSGSVIPDVLAAKDPKLTYRLDVITGKLDPIERRDLKTGFIYYHYSSRLNRWAWSYYLGDGKFWYAYGEGTTQYGWSFDIRASRAEIEKRLEAFPELAKRMDRYDQSACLRLQADGRWKIIGVGRAPSIFNVETGELWQMFSKDNYIPVVHTNGRAWTVRNGNYIPANSPSLGR
jgi:hypothetical protein